MVSVPPVLDSAWVSAVGAVVAVGVAEHDVPSAVRVVAVGTEVVKVKDTDVRVVFLLGKLDEPAVKDR